ncbi:MAG: HEPN domain-containing protein [Archaeoglobaceae archaeon]
MKREIVVFAERAKKFEEVAKYLYRTKVFDLSAFNVEQALQLYLKFILAKELGYFPKTHSLTRLFNDLSKLDKAFLEFYEENEIIIKDIEDAYILSRYLPRDYSEKEVELMINTLEKFKERFKEWLSRD